MAKRSEDVLPAQQLQNRMEVEKDKQRKSALESEDGWVSFGGPQDVMLSTGF